MPLNAEPAPVTFPDPLIRILPTPVAVCWAKMPRPARPTTGPDVVTVIEPDAFWVETTPFTAPVIGPLRFTLRFAGLAGIAPVAYRSIASPTAVVMLPLPVMATGSACNGNRVDCSGNTRGRRQLKGSAASGKLGYERR